MIHTMKVHLLHLNHEDSPKKKITNHIFESSIKGHVETPLKIKQENCSTREVEFRQFKTQSVEIHEASTKPAVLDKLSGHVSQ